MPQAAIHTRGRGSAHHPADPAGGDFVPSGGPLSFPPPPAFDRPQGAANNKAVSPVTIAKLPNVQEFQSGADVKSGVHASSIAGGDYSREQGVGRSPGFQWPFNFRAEAFNFNALDRWDLERSGLGLTPPEEGINPYVGVYEPPYSPIAVMDQFVGHFENDPRQHFVPPAPVSIPVVEAPSFSEQAVLG